MAERIEWFDVTVPAMTAKASPVETDMTFDAGEVERVEITIPDGHAGLTGIVLMQAHQQIIPWTSGSYIVGNDRTLSWDLHAFLNNGSWSASCYNTDQYDHTFHVAFLVNESAVPGEGVTGTSSSMVSVGGVPVVYTGSSGIAPDITPPEE